MTLPEDFDRSAFFDGRYKWEHVPGRHYAEWFLCDDTGKTFGWIDAPDAPIDHSLYFEAVMPLNERAGRSYAECFTSDEAAAKRWIEDLILEKHFGEA